MIKPSPPTRAAALLAAIALHVLAIAFYARKGANLVTPMITGRAEALSAASKPHMVGVIRAIVVFALSALATAALTLWAVRAGRRAPG